ncbi:MAG: RsmD family RNA methyltransferase [Bacteroidaceae bacterium]
MELSAETRAFISLHASDDVRLLALQAGRYPQVDMAEAVVQIAGRQCAARKIPSWSTIDGLFYPRHLSLEQCSSEPTALYKASLVSGKSFADLTGGFGVDCSFLSRKFQHAFYVERQAELCEIAKHNFTLLGLPHVEVVHAEAEEFLHRLDHADCIFLDPARRDDHGEKTFAIEDCTPNVKLMAGLLQEKASCVVVKLSPMLDLTKAWLDLPSTNEVHVVSVNNECKELLLIMREGSSEKRIVAVNLKKEGVQQFVFAPEEERAAACSFASEVLHYLYEPNASVMKAGAYKSVAQRYGLQKLHRNTHLYTSEQFCVDFPGRVFVCEEVISFAKKNIKQQMKDIAQANLAVRNFSASVAELRRRLKIAEGGDCFLFATTLADERKVLVKCSRITKAMDENE